ncbi:PepSY domain-containing protein [Pseudonocardia ammonioxydans]|uniref:PepSY domain-containing protein n=1 Tax=Pseudonocardia ammonioxydans TaxID=260086 RepID=UPI0015A71A68|nr:PepSY domain-containing protein [Pseudonocardia ammonioxydans]
MGLGLALVLLVEFGTGTLLLYRRELAGDGADGPFWGLLLNLHDCGLACPHLPGHVPALAAAVPGLGGTTWGGLGLGVLGAALAGLALSGVAAWWPVRRFGRAVRATLRPKFDRGPFRRHRDLHDLAALAALPLLLVWAVTGAVNGVLRAGPGMATGIGGLGLHSGAFVPGWARVPWALAGLAVLYVAGSGIRTWRIRTRRTRRAGTGRAPAIPRQRTAADPRAAEPGASAAGAGRPAVESGTDTTGPGLGPTRRARTGPGSGDTGSGAVAGAPPAGPGAPPGLPDHVVAGSVVADAALVTDRHTPATAPRHQPPAAPRAPRLPAAVSIPAGVGRPVLPATVPVRPAGAGAARSRPEHGGCRVPALRTVALVRTAPGGGTAQAATQVAPPPVAASASPAVPHPAAVHRSAAPVGSAAGTSPADGTRTTSAGGRGTTPPGSGSRTTPPVDAGTAPEADGGAASPATVADRPPAPRNGPVAPVPAQRRHPPGTLPPARAQDATDGNAAARNAAAGNAAAPGPPAPCEPGRRARNPYSRRRRRRARGRRS